MALDVHESPAALLRDVPSSQRSVLVGDVTSGDLLPQRQALATSLDDGEFLATLLGPTPGAPSYVIARRADGRTFDEIVLHYGGTADHRRTWRRVGERGSQADYALADDTTSCGFATFER